VNDTVFGKRKLHHPKTLIILSNVSKRKLLKLQTWLNDHDHIDIAPYHNGRELIFINETRRPRDPPASPAELERIRVVMERYHAERKMSSDGNKQDLG
jgi:hypothetical protein